MRQRIHGLVCIVLLSTLFIAPQHASTQEKEEKADPSLLTLDRIFGKEFSTESVGPILWLKKSSGYTLLEDSREHKGFSDIVRIEPKSGKRTVLVSASNLIPYEETKPLEIESYSFSPNEALVLIYTNSRRVWRQNTRGDYWIYDLTSRELTQIGGEAKASTLMFASFSPDSKRIAYVRERNIYVEDLKSKKIWPVTKTESDTIINGTFDWVYEEELGLQKGFRWSPDSKKIAFWQLDTKGVGTFHLINTTDGVYTKLFPIPYPKVGTTNSKCRIGVVTVDGKPEPYWLFDSGEKSRDEYLARMYWIPETEKIMVQKLNRLQNSNTILVSDTNIPQFKGEKIEQKKILTDSDDAWIDVHDNLEWVFDNSAFTWLSERDGWRRAYLVSTDGSKVKPITPEKVDVMDVVHVDEDTGWLYYYASPTNATQQDLYRASLDGSKSEKITVDKYTGWNTYRISPEGKYAIHEHSDYQTPPKTYLIELPSHKVVRVLVENKEIHEKVSKLKRQDVEFFQVDIGDDIKLDAWCMKPYDFDKEKKYPTFFYVYGEPAGQTVLDRWRTDRYLWHLMLTQQGYVVLSVDNRGTPGPRGRAWRKVVYRQIGALASREQAAATKTLLKERPYLDAKRVGIWGWSGGGTMSLHQIFRHPELYHVAMSIAPVTNERYYDTIYSERYMGLPPDNVKGYYENSPINYAKGLKGKLLLVHGSADDNVHFQNSEALINELIKHNKQFSMMMYPNRTHSIKEGKNTRRHLFGLLTRYLNRNLPVEKVSGE